MQQGTYRSPFRLLGIQPGVYSPQDLQRIRKRFLAEFELNEGAAITSWYGSFSKQEMLDTIDLLTDPLKQHLYGLIDRDAPLLCFFENNDPVPLSLVQKPAHYFDREFRALIGNWFAPQLDRLAGKALEKSDWVMMSTLARCEVLATNEQLNQHCAAVKTALRSDRVEIAKLQQGGVPLSWFYTKVDVLFEPKKLKCLVALPSAYGWLSEAQAALYTDLLVTYAENKGGYATINRVAQSLSRVPGVHQPRLKELFLSGEVKKAWRRQLLSRIFGWSFPVYIVFFVCLMLLKSFLQHNHAEVHFSLLPAYRAGYLFFMITAQVWNIIKLRWRALSWILLLFIPFFAPLAFWWMVAREPNDPMNRWIGISTVVSIPLLVFTDIA